MAIHTKHPGESMALFRKRVLAWNEGEPVPPKIETGPEDVPTAHDFHENYTYCMKPNCYAKLGSSRNSRSCPQEPGYIHNPILRRLFGWM